MLLRAYPPAYGRAVASAHVAHPVALSSETTIIDDPADELTDRELFEQMLADKTADLWDDVWASARHMSVTCNLYIHVGAAICLFVSSLARSGLYTGHLAVVTHPYIAARGGQTSASAAVPAWQRVWLYQIPGMIPSILQWLGWWRHSNCV